MTETRIGAEQRAVAFQSGYRQAALAIIDAAKPVIPSEYLAQLILWANNIPGSDDAPAYARTIPAPPKPD